jgi:hypothetical protein
MHGPSLVLMELPRESWGCAAIGNVPSLAACLSQCERHGSSIV